MSGYLAPSFILRVILVGLLDGDCLTVVVTQYDVTAFFFQRLFNDDPGIGDGAGETAWLRVSISGPSRTMSRARKHFMR